MARQIKMMNETQKVKSKKGKVIHTAEKTPAGSLRPVNASSTNEARAAQQEQTMNRRQAFRQMVSQSLGGTQPVTAAPRTTSQGPIAAQMPQDNPYLKAAARQILPAYQRPVDPITAAAANMLRNNARGNIDLYNRPQYRQPDGSISTVNSISIGTDEGAIPSVNGKGMEVLIPTIGRDKNGRPVQWTDEEAIDHYYKTGENLGKFNTVEEANDYAEKLHRQQEAYYSPENSPLRLNNVVPRPYELGDAVQRFQQTGEMYISPELKKMMEEAPDTGQGIRSSTQEEVNAAADWTAQRVANAEQQQRVREMRTFDRHNPIIAGALQGTGLPSMLTAGEQALARLTGNEEAQKQSAQIYADELREAQGLQARHPLAYNVGNVAGNIATVVGIGKVIGAIPAFANMSNLAQAVVSGAGAMGGTTAIQEAGTASTGMISPKDYALDIATGAGAGAAGGAVSSQIAGAGMNFLRNHGLTGNALAQTVVAGLSSSGYSGAGTAVRQGSAYLRDPENYQFDAEQAAKDAAVAFAFGAFSFAWRNRQNFTMNQEDPNQRPSTKYFDDCKTPGEIDSKLRQYARQYHPDQPNGNADLFAEISAEATAMKAWMNVNNGARAYQRAQEAYSSGDTAEYQAAQQEYNAAVNALMVDVQSGAIQGNEAVEALQILQSVSANLAGPEAQAPVAPGSDALAALADQGFPLTEAQPPTTGAEMFPQAQGVPGNPYEMTAAQKLDTAARQLQAREYERSQHPSVEQLNDELNSPFAVFENENPEIAQIQTRTGEQKLAALAAQATANQAEQKNAQLQAIYDAGKKQNPDFQAIMDRATMLTEAEKTSAFERGLTAAAAEAAGIGKEISYGGQQQEEGNYLSGEGSGRNLPLSAGERDGGVSSEAGGVAEGWQNWTTAADPDLRRGDGGAEGANVTLERGVPAEKVIRTAAPGQVIYPVKDGGTPAMRKTQARINAYDPDITQTPFVSKGDILSDKGEYFRAFADPVKRQIGYRINDEQASSDKTGGIHEVLEMANIDGKIDLSEAEDLTRHVIPEILFKDIIKAYQNNGPEKIGIQHAIKEAIFDITAGINQFNGHERWNRVSEAIDFAHGILYDYFNDVLGGVFDAEYDETAAATAATAETAAGTGTEATAPSRIVGENPKVDITDKDVSVDNIVPTITEMPENPPEYSSTLYREPAQKELFTLSKDGEITVKEKLNMSGRDFLIKQMKEKGYRDKKNTLAWLDKTADFMDKAETVYTYIGLDDIRNTKLVIDPRSGNIVLRALVKNGEYPVNIDLTKECTRRIALGKFVDWLSRNAGRKGGKTMLEEVPLTASNLVLFNKILKDEGFDTACLGCFVETRRYRIQEWADSFIEKYNKAVEKNNPNAEYFNFSDKNVYVSDLSKKDLADLNEALESYKANVKEERNAKKAFAKAEKERLKSIGATKKQIDDVKSELSNEEKINALVRSNKIYQKKLRVSDLITPGGRTVLHRDFPELESLVLGHYGSNTPKSVELFTPYNYDLGSIQAVGKQTLQEYVTPIAGAREQSFSDSVPTHLMDQMEKTADMAVNKLPDHIYTKVPSEVMLFGLTRRKFNMSIMFNIDPDVDSAHAGLRADGSYFVGDRKTSELEAKAGRERTFVQSFPYDMARKIQHMPGYSKHCGMIGVGYSYFHIKKMLADPEFGYLIGYHPSGMNGELASASYIEKATSYEPVQNTLKIKGLRHVTGELDGLPSYASWPQGTKTTDNKMIEKTKFTMKDFDMKGNLKKYGGKETMRRFLAWLEENRLTVDTSKASYDGVEQHGVGSFPLYEDLAKTKNYRKTADNYITWCLENDMLPEFYEFADDDNYFNFIYDYTPYDHNTGKYSPQLPVQMIFPDNFFKLANHALNQWNNYMMRQEPKAIPTFEKMYDEAVRYSSRLNLSGKMDSAGTELTTKQEEYFKDSKIRDEEGNLLRVYHGTYEDFNVFDKNKGRSTMDIQGSFFTPWDIDAEGYGPNVKTVYLNIKNPAPERVAYKALNMFKGQNNAGTKAREYLISKGYDGVNNNNEEYIAFYPEQIKNIDNQNPTSSEDIRYSSKLNPSEYGPTFYSKLQREIQNYKGEKIGAASVESYLKGKGVKDEEIKWSGIRTFLEGKKSVNKAELMEYLKANEMEIEQTVLDDNPVFIGPDVDGKERTFRSIEEIQKLYADKYGEDVLRNEDYDDYMERYSFSIGDEDYSFSKESSGDNETHWQGYKLNGGENYREVLFRIPGSSYTNTAMNAHWGDTGVLAHARVQDFDATDGGKVLFVEEIQSDWHNAGQKEGYRGDKAKSSSDLKDTEKVYKEKGAPLIQKISKILTEEYGIADRYADTRARRMVEGSEPLDRMRKSFDEEMDLPFAGESFNTRMSDELYDTIKEAREYAKPYLKAVEEQRKQKLNGGLVPDAPFRTTYTDYVLKNLLRMAAEGNYDYLAWTTGKMQEERWSDEFAEGYRIEYDQQIPKFLKKYGKQWGAGLDTIGISLYEIDDFGPDEGIQLAIDRGIIKDVSQVSMASRNDDGTIELDYRNEDGKRETITLTKPAEAVARYSVPAIVVNDAMKESVLTEGQPMYSTKLKLNGREVELTDREEELMDQLNTSYLDRIDEITQQKDAEIAALQEEMERTVGEEKKKARERLERLRKQKNDRIAYLEKQWRENTNRRIADLKEKAKNKLGEQHDDMMRRLAKLQAQKDKKIEDILAEHRRQRQDARDKRNDQKLRVKFQKLAQRAVRDSKNKPGMASQRVQELLKNIDLKALGMRDETKWELRRKYQEILEMKEKDENYAALFADRDMKKVERLFKTQINEMSVEDINDLITELSALAHYQENTDRLLKDSQGRSAAEVGRQIVKDLKELSPLEVTNPVKRLSAKYLRDNLSPERAFNRLSGYKHDNAMKTFYRTQVLDGLTKVKRFEQKADELKQEFIKDEKNKFFLNNGSKQTIPVTDKYGRTAMISPAMRVSLYMASKNTDNLRHIATDGVTVPEPKTYAKGMIEDAYGRGTTLVLDPTDVKAICNGMTDSEKEFATLLKIFFDTYAKDAINETSVDLDGILRATVENYFPITSDKNFLAKSMDSFQDPTLEGWNNLKSRQEGANNKILLEDARQVLQRHIRNTARYHGLAVPMRNWGKVYGYTSHRDEATGTRNSVQSAIKNAWDADTADYIERLIRDDINSGGRKAERGIADAMRSAYAGATLTLNPSVALKQTTSYLMAGSILDSGSLMYGLAHGFTKKDEAYMDSITPWGWARRQGESTIELGDLARKMDPITKNTPNWNQAMDVWTTNRLFLATEESVRKEFPDLHRGDKKYDETLAERYNQVLWRTQPQYEAAFRPEYLRKTDIGSRTFGMFKTESMQMSGELIDSWGQWRADSMRTKDAKNIYDKHPGDQTKSEYETNDKYRKESAKQFYRTFTSWVASNMLFAIMGTALNIGLLHKGKPYRNEKGEIDWETIAKKTALNFVGSSLGGFFYASTAADIGAYLYGKLSGENPTWYDIEVPGISLMNDAVENMGNLTGVLTNEEANNAAKAQAIAKFALAVSKFTPVGFAENIVNLANSVVLYNQDVKEGTFGKWEAGKGLLKDTSPTKDQYANRAVDAARKGDMATAERALKKTKKANLEKAVGRPITENMYKKIMEDPNNLRNYLGVALEDITPSIKNVPDHGYSSFTKLREDIGDPERTQNWHHIVEQEQMEEGLAGFKSTQVNNTNNIVSIPSGSKSPHSKISEYYGSVQDFTDGKTVREWLKDKSFEEQWEFGVKQLREYGDLVPTTNGWVFVPDKEKMETKIPMSEGKAKEKTDMQRTWESRLAEAREDGGLTGREVRDAALTMLKDGLTADEVIELYRSNQKSDKKLDEWKGSFEDYLNSRNAIDDAKAIKDSDKKRQKEKRKQAVEDYLRQYHGTEEDELLLWKLAGYGENTFVYR